MTKLASLKIRKDLGINVLLVLSLLLSLVSFSFPAKTEAAGASLYLAPANGTFFVGSTFDVSVFVNTGGNNVNAVKVDLEGSFKQKEH